MAGFDWHSDPITPQTPVTKTYRMTQNVRRFLRSQCGDDFKFDVPFMAWVKSGEPKVMSDIAAEWLRRKAARR